MPSPIRIVSAASLFDGHDAAINIMRRILQAKGAEVIHLGHNRSVKEIVDCAIQEDAQAIALTSYQGGHTEYLKYMVDLLREAEANIKIIAGGGGTILPAEIEELEAYGVEKIYSPDDGRKMGLEGMIDDVLKRCAFTTNPDDFSSSTLSPNTESPQQTAKLLTLAENHPDTFKRFSLTKNPIEAPVLGVTGTGGAGKSSVIDELVRRYLLANPAKTIAILSVDPTRRRTGGALLGDRIRMNALDNSRVFMRSMATRATHKALSGSIDTALDILKACGYGLIILESSGIGQSDTEITDFADLSLYVMTPEYGAATQLEKIDMLDYADVVAINKFDKPGAEDALRDVKKQFARNKGLWHANPDELPVFGTTASLFDDPGTNALFNGVITALNQLEKGTFNTWEGIEASTQIIIPPDRSRYLAEIAEQHELFEQEVENQSTYATQLFQLQGSLALLNDQSAKTALSRHIEEIEKRLSPENKATLERWPKELEKYRSEDYSYIVRGKEIKMPMYFESLSHTKIPKISLPSYSNWGDILRWCLRENMPGKFPYTSGVFPMKRKGERPTRMFAGEGGPERTNKRFHYLSKNSEAKRLSTAFDSVTLYGEDPDHRPDIYGKVGNSGVSVATLDDAKRLYSGFNLASPSTSVSMTINGPAPMLLAFFLNTAIDQQCELFIKASGQEEKYRQKIAQHFSELGIEQPHYRGELPEGNDGLGLMLLGLTGDQILDPENYQRIRQETLSAVRGTVQADILKEDQAQNTCIFSTAFALRMMADIQEFFTQHKVRNFYSVSISGYHIAEAGANPITQLAFTLANGFTFVEYYLSRGLHIDDFAPNLSFFFSNGLDPEYAVIGRVARRIWAKAMRYKYNANDRSQKLKYHIQTSGRSLHAQEIAFNDIRTTLQALYAIYDNCNSLHTNAYDEAITTPTEESVRRAMAIQLIINEELGLAGNENPLQGAFIIEELTDLVEEAVMQEFCRISERGGVLGAMERMYQRSKIQEESMAYEHKKSTGELPIIGVNTFLNEEGSPIQLPEEVIRATNEEKNEAISALQHFQNANQPLAKDALEELKTTALSTKNTFECLMETAKHCSLGQMTHALYEVGGKYRRGM